MPKEKTYHALIQLKSRGYLINTSADVVFVSRRAENVVKSRFMDNGNYNIKNTKLEKIAENAIIREYIGSNIFHDLREHTKFQEPLRNHRLYLIKLIVQ